MNAVGKACVILGILGFPAATVFAEYDIAWWACEGGGGISAGGAYAIEGTVGQPDARSAPQQMKGGGFTLVGGFWVVPTCPPFSVDFDGDCDVDQADFSLFHACFSGAAVSLAPGCEAMDLDVDFDVDPSDFGIFQRCYTGEGNPAAPGCAD